MHYPKVERITSTSGGLTLATRTVLLNMQPETQGQSHQISNITIGPDGKLYVHNGDGFDASTAQNLTSFRGKILRMNLDGTAPTDNPFYNAGDGVTATDYVYAYGLRNPFGGAWRAADNKHYTVENGPSVDRLSQLVAGRNYLYNGSDASMMNFAIYNWNPSTAPVNITFIQQATFGGSQFPVSKMDHAFISESGPTYAPGVQSNGKQLTEMVLDANGNRLSGPTDLVEYIGTGRSTIVGLAAGPDGLYFSELYEETGASGPTATGAGSTASATSIRSRAITTSMAMSTTTITAFGGPTLDRISCLPPMGIRTELWIPRITSYGAMPCRRGQPRPQRCQASRPRVIPRRHRALRKGKFPRVYRTAFRSGFLPRQQ